MIAAEDTRVTIKLLNHFEIKHPLQAIMSITKEPKVLILSFYKKGKYSSRLTDTGTPAFRSGEDLVKDAAKSGIKVPLPGAAAAICALVASGLSTERFVFEGFLPKKARDRKQRLAELITEQRTLIFYEAPHRMIKTLKALQNTLGDRRVVIAREMTKIHEEFIRGTIKEVMERFNCEPPRGEMVIVVEGANSEQKSSQVWENGVIEHELSRRDLINKLQSIMQKKMTEGLTNKQALKKAAVELGLSRNQAYELLLRGKSR